MHAANRARWNADALSGGGQKDMGRNWRAVWEQPQQGLDPEEWAWIGDPADRDIAVLGSGDNLAVFALAARGARVTSVDISDEQLAIAAARAGEVGADVRFLRADMAELDALATGSFDLVYTGGHVAVWLADLRRAYAEAGRILHRGGRLVVGEYHPIRRLWDRSGAHFDLLTSYFARGPFHYEVDGLSAYEWHWTSADLISAVQQAGCDLLAVEEYGDEAEQWEPVDLRGLPRQLLIVGEKQAT